MFSRNRSFIGHVATWFFIVFAALFVPVSFIVSRLPKFVFMGFVAYSLFTINNKLDFLIQHTIDQQEISQKVTLEKPVGFGSSFLPTTISETVTIVDETPVIVQQS